MKQITGGATAAKGFQAACTAAGIKYENRTDMAMLYSQVPCRVAGTFTTNLVKAAPVLWDRDIVKNSEYAQAVVVNAGIANACTGQEGLDYCQKTADQAAKVLGIPASAVCVASTGVIGKQLPIDRIMAGVEALAPKLADGVKAGNVAAKALMTTDTHEKEVAVEFEVGGKTVTIGGMCKGSGMIHPNMCTMLAVVTTDLAISKELLQEAKRLEFPDKVIGSLTGKTEREIKELRNEYNIHAAYKMVDTCAAEFDAATPYYYSCYDGENEVKETSEKKKVMVLGSGPIRIGQGIEFDFCSVHSVWALSKEGYETIIVNNNPETVSTDFDVADKLYFEPLTAEDVESIVDLEKPDGAVVQFGGQTAIKLTEALMKMGVPILGTSAENVDAAEDRELFDEILEECCIPRPKGTTVFTCEEALEVAHKLGYPVLVRPSYVLGGQGMQIAVSDEDITAFMEVINRYEQEHPILIDKYLVGKEVEVDAVCDGTDILIPGIMEHVERAGIHSGDSISVYPSINLTDRIKRIIAEYTRKLAKSLHVIGLINIQFIVADDEVYVIEVNPRSSRTVPYISKVTGIPIVALAAKVITGAKIRDLGYEPGLQKESEYYAVKKPVFSFEKLRGAEISLGPEMKSTGECLGISKNFHEALYKAFLGAGVNLPKYKKMILTVKDSDKIDAIDIGRRFEALGYEIFSTKSTCRVLNEAGVHAKQINKLEEESPNLLDLILDDKIDLVIDTPSQGVGRSRDGFLIRRYAIETGVTCLTSLDTADALLTSLETGNRDQLSVVDIAQI